MGEMDKRPIIVISVALTLFFIAVASAQDITKEKIRDVEFDQIEVIYAADGYIEGGDEAKYFILGVVRLHKPGAPESEWSRPIFYFELGEEAILSGTTSYYYHSEREENQIKILPILKELRTISGSFDVDFVFYRNGKIDVGQSKIGIVPESYRSGRYVTQLVETGEYYKTGGKTEKFVPQRDANGKITNMEEMGEPIFEERSILTSDVCFEYRYREEESLYQSTELCSVYTIKNISRSAGLPNARELGLISTDPHKLPNTQESEVKKTEINQSSVTNETVVPPTSPPNKSYTTNKSVSASNVESQKEEESQEASESIVVSPSGPTPTVPAVPPSKKSPS